MLNSKFRGNKKEEKGKKKGPHRLKGLPSQLSW